MQEFGFPPKFPDKVEEKEVVEKKSASESNFLSFSQII